jgi:hypothetical protein
MAGNVSGMENVFFNLWAVEGDADFALLIIDYYASHVDN